jgi:N-acetylneuraminic acid mutarotase
MRRSTIIFSLLSLLTMAVMAPIAQAHFLWIVTDNATGEAKVYFGESPEPDDPDLLAKLAGLKLHLIGPRDAASDVDTVQKDAALVAPAKGKSIVTLSHNYGVIERGGEKFLLNYHAKAYPTPLTGSWKAVQDAKILPLEIVPAAADKQVELTVLWNGKPLADAPLVVAGAGLDLEAKTNAQGRLVVQPTSAGLLSARAKHVVSEAGKADDKAYDSIRHYSTLTVPVNQPQLKIIDHKLPPLAHGVTSFGGAAIGDEVYVYGGHLGGAHHYWKEGQSNELLKLNLKNGTAWESVITGPRRTGTAMVAYGNKLYRIGGFEALNAEKDEGVLHSMADGQSFDPATGKWTALPDMPTPRSSFDAAVLDGTLYVVGGWNLQEGNNGEFLSTMLTLDLNAKQPAWKSHPVPFKRRALSVAAHDGKIYALGGMQESGGTTTDCHMYDPKTGKWADCPALHGQAMEAFGNSSFEIDGKLLALTMSGAVQQLADDGKSWLVVGQLEHPRFFARLLPWGQHQAVIVGGADMSTGKTNEVEILAPAAAK